MVDLPSSMSSLAKVLYLRRVKIIHLMEPASYCLIYCHLREGVGAGFYKHILAAEAMVRVPLDRANLVMRLIIQSMALVSTA